MVFMAIYFGLLFKDALILAYRSYNPYLNLNTYFAKAKVTFQSLKLDELQYLSLSPVLLYHN